jgi:hypothetical protein
MSIWINDCLLQMLREALTQLMLVRSLGYRSSKSFVKVCLGLIGWELWQGVYGFEF